MSRRWRWIAFLLSLVLAVGTAAWIGWTRYDKLDPRPRHVLTPDGSVEVRGLVFTLDSFGQVDVPEENLFQEVPDGAVWVQLTVTLDVQRPSVEESEDEWYCSMELVTDHGMWQPDTYTMSLLGLQEGCTSGYDQPNFEAGETAQRHALWLVPEKMLVNPRVVVQFTPPPEAIEIRPAS